MVARWSTGIAEVALPSSFREKTYAETEAMAKKRREIEELESLVRKNATSSGFARFHVEDPTFSVIPVELLAPKIAESASQPNNRANRPERASDFQAFGEFKKRLNKLRR